MKSSTLWTLGLIGAALLLYSMQQQQQLQRAPARRRNMGRAFAPALHLTAPSEKASAPAVSSLRTAPAAQGGGGQGAGSAGGGAGGGKAVNPILRPMQPAQVVIAPRVTMAMRPGTPGSPGTQNMI